MGISGTDLAAPGYHRFGRVDGTKLERKVQEGLHPVGTQQIKDENGNDDTDRLQWDR